MGLLFFIDDRFDAADNVGHVVRRDAALGDAVAYQRVHSQLSVSDFQCLVEVSKCFFANVLRVVEINFPDFS